MRPSSSKTRGPASDPLYLEVVLRTMNRPDTCLHMGRVAVRVYLWLPGFVDGIQTGELS